MNPDVEIREIPLSVASRRAEAERLLTDCGLHPDLPPLYLGVYDGDDRLLAGAGLDGNVVKCVAVREETRGEALINPLFSQLLVTARMNGHRNVSVYTKPEHRRLFESLAMHYVGGGSKAILLESDARGIAAYCDRLRRIATEAGGQRRGVVVMNCNPLTIGHHYLIKQAAQCVDRLFVIPVTEDRSMFATAQRVRMIEECCAEFNNVTVCPGSGYSISRATFPSYFLKEISDATEAHIELDCDIFRRHIAPALGATVRFVGTEPTDGLTALYNKKMRENLGIEVREIERLDRGGVAVSASRLRRGISDPSEGNPLVTAHRASRPCVLAAMARQALVAELETTPKPGLVDLSDNGSHRDMDARVMRKGIEALVPWFEKLARAGVAGMSAEQTRGLGIEAEKAMYDATGGVNTHKGALFSMGLMIYAAAASLHRSGKVTEEDLSNGISGLARSFSEAEGTHGDKVRRQGGRNGALELARTGYRDLFAHWLPAYRSFGADAYAPHRTLLVIMSTLNDSNVAYRAGMQTMEDVKREAAGMLASFSREGLERMNGRFKERDISPGGCADMLALTMLAHSLTAGWPDLTKVNEPYTNTNNHD